VIGFILVALLLTRACGGNHNKNSTKSGSSKSKASTPAGAGSEEVTLGPVLGTSCALPCNISANEIVDVHTDGHPVIIFPPYGKNWPSHDVWYYDGRGDYRLRDGLLRPGQWKIVLTSADSTGSADIRVRYR
jgi:hypothetical protein